MYYTIWLLLKCGVTLGDHSSIYRSSFYHLVIRFTNPQHPSTYIQAWWTSSTAYVADLKPARGGHRWLEGCVPPASAQGVALCAERLPPIVGVDHLGNVHICQDHYYFPILHSLILHSDKKQFCFIGFINL